MCFSLVQNEIGEIKARARDEIISITPSSVLFITFRGIWGMLILGWDAWFVLHSKRRAVRVVQHASAEDYLVSSRKGVMFHVALRLAVTPLGADATR